MKRWQAIDRHGRVLAVGQRLMDVEGPGGRILVDYRKLHYAYQGIYPLTRYCWYPLYLLGSVLRKG